MSIGQSDGVFGLADIPLAKARHYLNGALKQIEVADSLEKFEAAKSEIEAARAAIQEAIELAK